MTHNTENRPFLRVGRHERGYLEVEYSRCDDEKLIRLIKHSMLEEPFITLICHTGLRIAKDWGNEGGLYEIMVEKIKQEDKDEIIPSISFREVDDENIGVEVQGTGIGLAFMLAGAMHGNEWLRQLVRSARDELKDFLNSLIKEKST